MKMNKINIIKMLAYVSIFLGGLMVDLNYKFWGVVIVGVSSYTVGVINTNQSIKKDKK